ncbi:mitochondrial ribosome biogenesis GTP-binding protein YqeH [Andalucia godoyi]|uniref:Mitochondrial ribosome biogenesis GTP-binding protein YqeH n=1 Tax=Andalucia godoyi TaxID=505711 RepID=A0A8K0AG55_ANDGO|nr:mitochondrial ribosome biogenesis GTP-binding protein YqeH [Andalucia godoyi]|eukprot:ANDGO_07820.mRNA.1 mitochondrial ribosome biogenesis GTP-binding protein YqeH
MWRGRMFLRSQVLWHAHHDARLLSLQMSAARPATVRTCRFFSSSAAGSSSLAVLSTGLKCPGCGAMMQNSDSAAPGYAPPGRESTCQRCYQMLHYGKHTHRFPVQKQEFETHLARLKRSKRSSVVVHTVDLVDCEGSLIPYLKDLVGDRNPVYFVATKLDVLPSRNRGEYSNRISTWFKHRVQDLFPSFSEDTDRTFVVSGQSGEGVHEALFPALKRFRRECEDGPSDVVVVGTTNSGKSTLVNHLASVFDTFASAREDQSWTQYDDPKTPGTGFVKSTVSALPSTTLSLVSKPIPKRIGGGFLIDTPGLERRDFLDSAISVDDWAKLCVNKKLVPRSFHLGPGSALQIGRYLRLMHVQGPECMFVLMAAPALQGTLVKPEDPRKAAAAAVGSVDVGGAAKEPITECELVVEGSGSPVIAASDIAIPGIGWISVVCHSPVRVACESRFGIRPVVRESLTPFASTSSKKT